MLPAPTRKRSFGQQKSLLTPDQRPWTAQSTLLRSENQRIPAGDKCACAVLERRNPVLLFRLSASFLFRLEARQFLALLFHEPPRTQRSFGRCPTEDDIRQ